MNSPRPRWFWSRISRVARLLAIAPIRFYQQAISPWLRPACRFEPSCSQYTVEAIETHGPARGIGLGVRRLLRCHPFGGSGFDPVPRA